MMLMLLLPTTTVATTATPSYTYGIDYIPDPSAAIINTDIYYTGFYYCYRSYSIRSFVVDVFDREGFAIAPAAF